jgi:hypothetical protein
MYPDVVVHIMDCLNGSTLCWHFAMILMKELPYESIILGSLLILNLVQLLSPYRVGYLESAYQIDL